MNETLSLWEYIVGPLLALVKCEFKLTRMTISRSPAVMMLLGDLNWPFKLLTAIIQIIFPDKKDSPWQMDITKRKLQKTIWISHFPMTQTVCRQKFHKNLKIVFLEIILSYTLDTSSSATDFSLTDTVSIRFVKIYVKG